MRPTIRAFAFLFASLTLASSAHATQISLTVEEPSAVARVLGPVTSGVPIASGDTASVWALFDGATEIPVQTKLLRGRLTSWLLVDFRATVGTSATKTYTLKTQSPTVSASPALSILDSTTYVQVITGPLKVRIGKTTFNLFDEVWLDRNHSGTFSDSAGRVEQLVSATSTDNIPLRTADDTLLVGRRAPHVVTWEDNGPLRATLRVDGHYARSGAPTDTMLLYTTRITFYAGQSFVNVTHVIRNSFLAEKRYVKVKTAKLVTGSGGTTTRSKRSGDRLWVLPGAGASTLELVPDSLVVTTAFTPARSTTQIGVDANGGIVLSDASHHGAFARYDFCDTSLSAPEKEARTKAFKNRLFARAEASWYSQRSAFGAKDFATWQDEKDANTNWGWSWPAGGYYNCWSVEHTMTQPGPTFYPSWLSLSSTNDLESDDLAMNLMMYARVGQRGYLDRADHWARYYAWEFAWRTDGFAWRDSAICEPTSPTPPGRPRVYLPAGTYTSSDQNYLYYNAGWTNVQPNPGGKDDAGGHTWNGGLIDYYYMTGDRDALAAAVDIAEFSGKRIQCVDYSAMQGGNIRGEARTYLELLRVWDATSLSEWRSRADHLRQMFLRSNYWDARGFYYTPTHQYTSSSIPTRYPGGRYFSPFQLGLVPHVLYLEYQLNPSDSVRTKIEAIASFAYAHGAHADSNYTGDAMIMDSLGVAAAKHHSSTYFQNGVTPWQSAAPSSVSFLDALTIGYRLTGNHCYLTRARQMWIRGSKYDFNGIDVMADATKVGRFMNSLECWNDEVPTFPNSGDLPTAQYYFRDAVGGGDFQSPATTSDLALTPGKTAIAIGWTAPGDDGTTGTATTYDLRQSTGAINASNFSAATPVTTGTPQVAGNNECVTQTGLTSCLTYYYALKTRDECGNWSGLSNLPSVTTDCTGNFTPSCDLYSVLRPERPGELPQQLEFEVVGGGLIRDAARIELGIPLAEAGEPVQLSVFDVTGRRVTTLFAGSATPGRHTILWTLANREGEAARSGAYFLALRIGSREWNRKLLLVR